MLTIAILAGVVLLVLMIAAGGGKGLKKASGGAASVSYSRRPLMTAREREFFVLLRSALPSGVEIYAQVSMGALVDVANGPRSERNRFDRKVLDFVVCAAGGDVLYVIELDDRSHGTKSAQQRDATKGDICAAAGMRLVRYRSVRTESAVLLADFERCGGVIDKVADAAA